MIKISIIASRDLRMVNFLISIFFFLISSLTAQELKFSGNWKYSLKDTSLHSKTAYNDSNWEELDSLFWKDDDKKTENRTLWIRKSIIIPSKLKEALVSTGALVLSMGRIEQSDQTFLNGKLIGSMESGNISRDYVVNFEDIKWDQENSIAIRIGHWGRFSMSKIPALKAAAPENIFTYSDNLRNSLYYEPIKNEEKVYELTVVNNSSKEVSSIIRADFYDFNGVKIHTEQKKINLKKNASLIRFKYKSPVPFLKVKYTTIIPTYKYLESWNGLYGFDDIIYQKGTPKIDYKAKQEFEPVNMNHQKIDGWLGDKLLVNSNLRLKNIDQDELLEGFVNRPGKHSWIGEHIGKFLEAACNSYANNQDIELKRKIDYSAQHLIASQLDNGYLGTYTLNNHWTSWDVWSHKYNMIGLLRYYEISGFEPALNAAKKIGALLYDKFGEGQAKQDIIKSGAHKGMAAASVLDPMTDLYRYTGEQKFLDFCYYIIASYDHANGPHILSSLESSGRVDKVANTKAYEMLSNLIGITKFYRLTNKQEFILPILQAWNDITINRLYITGTASSFEHFQDDHVLPANNDVNMGEGCVTTTWLQLNYQLFCISGNFKYLDELERTYYNHLLGAESPQTGGVSYYTPLMGTKPYSTKLTCCLSSIPRGIAMLPLFANGLFKGNPLFLFYNPGEFKVNLNDESNSTVNFKTITEFPKNGEVKILVNMEKPETFKSYFRVPYWASNYSIKINGVENRSKENFFGIERIWKNGDLIEIDFDLNPILHDGGVSYPNKVAIQRGPQILVMDEDLNDHKATVYSLKSLKDRLKLVRSLDLKFPKAWKGEYGYKIPGNRSEIENDLIVVPYADAGQLGGKISTWVETQD